MSFGARHWLRAAVLTLVLGGVGVWLIDAPAPWSSEGRHRYPTPQFAGSDTLLAASRPPVPCPPASTDTLVLFAMGQSNAGNYASVDGATANAAEHADHVYEYWNGACRIARSPMLGATGDGGSPWPHVGRALVSAGVARDVVIAVHAVDGAPIARYARGGDLAENWHERWIQLRRAYEPDAVLWVQGEADAMRKTDPARYARSLRHLAAVLHAEAARTPLLVATSTYCGNRADWTPDNPIATVQRGIGETDAPRVLPGPDLDRVLAFDGARHDGCHMTGEGILQASRAWIDVIRSVAP